MNDHSGEKGWWMIIPRRKAGGLSFRGEMLVDNHSEEKGWWMIIEKRKAGG